MAGHSWVGSPVDAHEKSTPEKKRATINPRPRMESSRQGESKYTVSIFVWSTFGLLFLKYVKTEPQQK